METTLMINLDLMALLREAIPHVFGSDERELLETFMERYSGPDDSLIVTIDLAKVMVINREKIVPGG